MSARDELIEIVTSSPESSGGDVVWATDLVDAYRTEVLTKAIGRLRAIPVTCTALTGPVWYGDGWNSAITQLEEIADYQLPDDEEYPGELARYRGLVGNLRVAARKADLGRVQQLLVDHRIFELDSRDRVKRGEPAVVDFFQPGHTYIERDGATDWKFRCDAITTHPEDGERTALGWRHFRGEWSEYAYGEDDWEIHRIADSLGVTGAGETA
jgi:hypothetical protein